MTANLYVVPAYEPLWRSNTPIRRFYMWGGRQAGRTKAVTQRVVVAATANKLRVVCVRHTETSTENSQRSEIREVITELGLDGMWNTTQTGQFTGRNGSRITFVGLMNQRGRRGESGMDICWVEEAQEVAARDFTPFRHTAIRKTGMVLYVTGNPTRETDPVYAWCAESRNDSDVLWLETDYRDNKYVSDEALRECANDKKVDPSGYAHHWLGQILTSSSDLNVISRDWVEASIDLYPKYSHLLREYSSDRQFGLDPASTERGDACMVAARSGPFVEHMERLIIKTKGNLTPALRKVNGMAVEYEASSLYFDETGIGSACTSFFAALPAQQYRVVPVGFGFVVKAPKVRFGRLCQLRAVSDTGVTERTDKFGIIVRRNIGR